MDQSRTKWDWIELNKTEVELNGLNVIEVDQIESKWTKIQRWYVSKGTYALFV